MKMRKFLSILCVLCLLCASMLSCKGPASNGTADSNGTDTNNGVPAGPALTVEEGAVDPSAIEFKKKDLYYDYSDGVRIALSDSASASGTGYNLASGELDITAGGTYVLSGKLSDGHITVDAPKESDVRLVLEGVDIYCTYSAPILVKCADKVIISLPEGTENKLEDKNTSYDTDGSKITAVVYSHESISFNGTGKLNIKAQVKDGITSKDTVKITGGDITIDAKDDGIVGRDRVLINGGNVTIGAVGDGIKSSKNDDAALGYVYIGGGKVAITADGDAVAAETSVLVAGGELDIKTGGGADNITADGKIKGTGYFGKYPSQSQLGANSLSMKGIKAKLYIDITGGSVSIDSADDAINCDNAVRINNGTLSIKTGDDAIYADTKVQISGSKITVSACYEGIEAQNVELSGGHIEISSPATSVNSAERDTGRLWTDRFSSGESSSVNITGGEVFVNGTKQ